MCLRARRKKMCDVDCMTFLSEKWSPCYFLRFRKSWNFLKITHLKIFIFLEKYFIESPFLLKCSRSLHFTIEWTLGEIPQTRTSLSAKAYVLLMLIKVKMYLMRRCFKYKETYFCHKYMPAVLCLNLDKFVLHVN